MRSRVRWVPFSEAMPIRGSACRWRDNPRHPWSYGIYVGVQDRTIAFAKKPGSYPFVWMKVMPRFIQTIAVETWSDE